MIGLVWIRDDNDVDDDDDDVGKVGNIIFSHTICNECGLTNTVRHSHNQEG